MGLKTILMPSRKVTAPREQMNKSDIFDDVLKCVRVLATLKNHKAALWACMLAKSEIIFR